MKLLRERAARRARVVPRRQRAGKKRPGKKGLDGRIKKSSTRREATLDGAFPREAPGFLLHFLPIDRAAHAQPVEVYQPLQRRQAVPGGVYREVEKLPVRAQRECRDSVEGLANRL